MAHRNPRSTLTIPQDTKDRLKDLADRAGLPMSHVLKIMIHRFEREELL